jgi:5,10-methylenetetrahydromethanopterin reductase
VTIKNPVAAIEEALDLVRLLAAGKTICKTDGVWRMDHIHMELENPVLFPIYLAAKRKKMMDLAARKADGVVFSAGTSPAFIRASLDGVGPGIVGKANAGILLTSIAEHRKDAYDQARGVLAYLLQTPNLQEDWDLNGLEIDHHAIFNAMRQQNHALAASLISDRAVEILCAAGTPDDFRERLDAYRDAGVALPVIWPVGDPKTKLNILQSAIQVAEKA